VIGARDGDRQIWLAIAIEVTHGDRGRIASCRKRDVDGGLEGPIAGASQHRDVIGPIVGHRQVWHPIAIEVTHGDREGRAACGKGDGGLEGPIAGAQ